jgi:hypothetical protein
VARANALYAAESGVKEVFSYMNEQAADAARARRQLPFYEGQEIRGAYDWGSFEVVLNQVAGTDDWRLSSSGMTDSSAGVRDRNIEVVLGALTKNRATSRFGFAMFSDADLDLSGVGFTDSFDSAVGGYSPTAPAAPFSMPFQGANGHVGSNGNIINPSGGTEIHGGINPGVDGVAIFGGITDGDIENLSIPIELPPVPEAEWQAAQNNNDNATIVTLGGGSAYIPATKSLEVSSSQSVQLGVASGQPRTYFFTDVNTWGSGTKIDIVGPSVIYLTGDWLMHGTGTINHLGRPTDLMILGIGGGALTMNGASGFGAGVYAPDKTLTFNGSGEMRGAFTARSIARNGTWNFHYDEALGRIMDGPDEVAVIGYRVIGWHERSTSND